MTERKATYARFRSTVLQARAVLERPCGTESRGSACETLPAGTDQSYLTGGEAAVLSRLLILSALKIMQTSGALGALASDAPGSRAVNRLDRECRAADLPHLALGLHDRLRGFCPPDLFNVLPPPSFADREELETAWSCLSDAQLGDHWSDESGLGFVYQFFAGPLRRESQDAIQSSNKTLTLRRLITFTQLYTPNWVVDFLLCNSVLPQWSGLSCDNSTPYRLLNDRSENRLKAEELRIIDPACGSGHFLLRAFDLLLSIYRSEGWCMDEAISSILRQNLCGVDIDPVALWVSALSLLLRCLRFGQNGQLRMVRLASAGGGSVSGSAHALLGSLSQHWSAQSDHPLSQKHHAVVTNPPYIGRKLMDRQLKTALKSLYPDCHQDLCAAFVRRGLDLLAPGGRLGLIGQTSLLFVPSYGSLRQHLIDRASLIAVVEAGTGVFPLQGGEKVNSALLLVERAEPAAARQGNASRKIRFFDLSCAQEKGEHLKQLIHQGDGRADGSYEREATDFRHHRQCAFNYKFPALLPMIMKDADSLHQSADLRQGLATTDNERFVRYNWDVDQDDIGRRWFPYVKGGGSERWWNPVLHVVDWQDEGSAIKGAVAEAYPYLNGKTAWVVKNERYYFKPGLTFSLVNSRGLAVRVLPPGCIFDVAGSAIFADAEHVMWLLAYLNSSFVSATALLLNPTINFQVGDLKELPLLRLDRQQRDALADMAIRCVELKKQLCEPSTPSIDKNASASLPGTVTGAGIESLWRSYSQELSGALAELSRLEERLDQSVLETVCKSTRATRMEVAELVRWAERLSDRRMRSLPKELSASDFARWVIISSLNRLKALPLLLPVGDSRAVASALEIDPRSAGWLEDQLQMPLARYFLERFPDDSRRYFRGSPYYFAVPVPGADQIALFSSALIRGKHALKNSRGRTETVEKLLGSLALRLSARSDWTGKHLWELLRKA